MCSNFLRKAARAQIEYKGNQQHRNRMPSNFVAT